MALHKYLHTAFRPALHPLLFFILLTAPHATWGSETQQADNFIMHHISDAHEWHFVTLGIMFLLKLMVAFLQAYIFTLLSAIYFGTAVGSHEE